MVNQVLLAEDDPAINAFVSRVLNHLGYEITSAYNGLDAVEALNRNRFSMMITDVVMAGLDGIELIIVVLENFMDRFGSYDCPAW